MYEITIKLRVPDREQAAFQLSVVNYEVMNTIHAASLADDGKARSVFPQGRTTEPYRVVEVRKEGQFKDAEYYVTENCVACNSPAKYYTGHVMDGAQQITAGWCCFVCENTRGFVGPKGYCGEWRPALGKKKC